MSIETVAQRSQGGAIPSRRISLGGLLKSEWTKLASVRSTKWTLAIIVLLGLGLSALATSETRAHWSSMSFVSRATFDPTQTSLIGIAFGQFAIGVLGVLVMSAEYGTGTIRATFAAVPRRTSVLIAKALVFGAVALVVSELVSFVAFFLGQALLSEPAVHTTIGGPGALRQVVGAGLYLCVLGLFSLGLATIIRHTAGSISAFVGILLILPLIMAALPSSIRLHLTKFLPANIGNSITALYPSPNSFSPWVGLGVLFLYALAVLLVGGVLLVRRDA